MALVIPVFIPHEGCPHRCLFCNQRRISGQVGATVRGDAVQETIDLWLARCRPERRQHAEVAFYGGSFTCLPQKRQLELLAAVQPFLVRRLVQNIRLSTRPDGIDAPALDLLARYRVATIELGVQSCDDEVLTRSGRGHNSATVALAAQSVRARGFRLGIQLLPGLPGETFASLRRTTATVIGLRPNFVRIYPALVLRDSGLARLYHQGGYRPLSLDRAVAQTAWMKKRFDAKGIEVVRMGLQPTADLERALIAGPYHPAFGELVLSRLMFHTARKLLAKAGTDAPLTLVIAARDRSIFQGQHSANLHRLRRLGLDQHMVLRTDREQLRQTVRVGAG